MTGFDVLWRLSGKLSLAKSGETGYLFERGESLAVVLMLAALLCSV